MKKLRLVILSLILFSCVNVKTNQAVDWLNSHQRPIIIKKNIHGHTFISKDEVFFAGQTELSLPEVLRDSL